MKIEDIALERIDIYGGTQARYATLDDAVSSYAEEMANGAEFPPVTLFFDGAKYWLADGFHRVLAAQRNSLATIRSEIREGARTDALRFALGANATNGLYRSSADKRNAVEIALEEWPDLSNAVIAEICRVSDDLVRRCRSKMVKEERIEKRETVTGRDGKQYPAAVEREPRGVTEKSSSAGQGGGSGKPKASADFNQPGGSSKEIEAEARAMIRRGEAPSKELDTLPSATAMDYVETAIGVLERMRPADPKRPEAIARLERWLASQRNPALV